MSVRSATRSSLVRGMAAAVTACPVTSVVTDGSSRTRVIEFAAGLRTSPDDRQPMMAARRAISGDTALGVKIVLTRQDIGTSAVRESTGFESIAQILERLR